MPRGLDHVVHAVSDLEGAARLYRRLGFTVGARNRHSWGTHNHVVQLPGFFIELLTVAEPEKLGSDGFSNLFGRFNQSFLSNREGLSLLLLESDNAAADAAAFKSAGIGASEVLKFEREGKQPDGAAVKLAFSLAFARDARAPAIGFAVCQQHFPENFWTPQFQRHANGVTGVAGVVFVADNPADHHVFLKNFSGVTDLKSTSSGITIETPRGEIQVMDPAAFRQHFAADPPDVTRGMRLAAIRFAAEMAAARSALGSHATEHMGRLIVGPQAAHGATLVFELT